ncbi:MAG: hypothetical protein MPW14_19710 [Candidatus Manganitrophus sp.]|nr:MAG: hypothetical protein MPW14_19710 [Candidatus Manganitrophus sp.]
MRAGSVKIAPNGTAELDFTFDADEIDIPLHDLQTQFRLDTALQPRHLTPPSVELQRN